MTKCPDCKTEMIKVRFAFDKETGKTTPNVKPRFMCETCGRQILPEFPKKTSVYLHSNKEAMWDKGQELGLSEEAISDNFRSCCYEVKVNIEVNEDGTYKILSVEE